MMFKKTSLRLILILLLITECFAEQPPARKLRIPPDGGEKIYPADDESFKLYTRPFDTDALDNVVASIYCCPSWVDSFATIVRKDEKGAFSITAIILSYPPKGDPQRKVNEVALDTDLALRLIKLLKREFDRMVPGSSEKDIIIDGTIYLYSISEATKPRLAAKAQAARFETRLDRVNKLAGMLNSLAFAPQEERTGILTDIDWSITELELVGK